MTGNLNNLFKEHCTACYNFNDKYIDGKLKDRSTFNAMTLSGSALPSVSYEKEINKMAANFVNNKYLILPPHMKTPAFTHFVCFKTPKEIKFEYIMSCTDGGISMFILPPPQNLLNFEIYSNGYKHLRTSHAEPDTWYCVAMFYDNNSWGISLNGKSLIRENHSYELSYGTTSKVMVIGAECNGSSVSTDNKFNGFISEFRSYDKVLDDETIAAIHQEMNINLHTNHVSMNRSIQRTTLPMNSTDNILNKANDSREGLLGMANDEDNYGALYVVGHDGKSHLTKNGVITKELWSGSTQSETITISENLTNFNQIVFEVSSAQNPLLSSYNVSMTDELITLGKFSVQEYNTNEALVTFSKDSNELIIESSGVTITNITGIH